MLPISLEDVRKLQNCVKTCRVDNGNCSRPDERHQARAESQFLHNRVNRRRRRCPSFAEGACRAIHPAEMRFAEMRAGRWHGVIPFAIVSVPCCNSDQHTVFDLSLVGGNDAGLTGM